MRITLFGLVVFSCSVLAPASGPAAPDEGTVTGRVLVVRGKDTLPNTKDVWVYLQPVKKRGKQRIGAKNDNIVQRGKQFVPRVRVVPLGSSVGFPNNDKEEHNVFSPNEPMFDLGRYVGGDIRKQKFLDVGEYDIFCNLHVEMTAVVKVVESEWIAEVKDDTFTLRNVPSGTYKVVAWTPGSVEVWETITVADGATVTAHDLHLQAPKSTGSKSHKRKDGSAYPPYKRP